MWRPAYAVRLPDGASNKVSASAPKFSPSA